jgi:Arc/MetJ family transcription regulator
MKTTVDIPDDILREAMEDSGAETKREAILTALVEYTRKRKLAKARAMLGTFKDFMTVAELRESRNSRNKRNGIG